MKKILLMLFLLTASIFSVGQGSSATAPPTVFNQYGQPLGGAVVTICSTYPGTGVCNSLVPTFTDSTLSTSCSGTNVLLNNLQFPSVGSGCSNPGHADNLGNVLSFAVSGFYWCQFSGPALIPYVQPCVFPDIGPTGVTNIGTVSPIVGGPITSTGTISCPTCVYSTSPQSGDILRWNVSGDSTWDSVNYTSATQGIFALNGTSSLQAIGLQGFGNLAQAQNSSTGVIATQTLGFGNKMLSSSTGSTTVGIGISYGQNGSNSLMGITAFYRWSFRFALGGIGTTPNPVRYWMGLGCWNTGGAGNNNTQIINGSTGTAAYATDTPNKSTVGFRYSSGTDTHWQAIAITAGGSQTTTDTLVTPDTGVHLFEMTPSVTGTSINYFIDGVLVATISTNVPLASGAADSTGSLFYTGDNKNTATQVSLTFYSMVISLKL